MHRSELQLQLQRKPHLSSSSEGRWSNSLYLSVRSSCPHAPVEIEGPIDATIPTLSNLNNLGELI
jgi:hypothetical protein